MSVLSRIIQIAAPLPDIEGYDSFLFIGPHPDDIEIGAGATAAKLVSEGKKVNFLVCIDGRFGDGYTALRGDELAAERMKEAKKSADVLGVSNVRFLGYCDGNFYSYDELKKDIAKAIGEIQPDVIFAPDPDVISECHADHRNVGNICRELAFFSSNEGIMEKLGTVYAPVKAIAYYFTAKANRFIDTSGYLNIQLRSIFECHKTQFPEGCDEGKSISLYLKLRAHDFGLRKFCRTAEGFRVLGSTQMHCLPESGL